MTVVNSWNMHAQRYESGDLWNIGHKRWVALHGDLPIVPVLVEELDVDPLDPSVTHYGWWDFKTDMQDESAKPQMMYPRVGGPDRPDITPWMLLGMCFAHGMKAEIDRGNGRMVALRITEIPDPSKG